MRRRRTASGKCLPSSCPTKAGAPSAMLRAQRGPERLGPLARLEKSNLDSGQASIAAGRWLPNDLGFLPIRRGLAFRAAKKNHRKEFVMPTRRDFLKGGAAAGVVFCSCGMLHNASAQTSRQKLPVM